MPFRVLRSSFLFKYLEIYFYDISFEIKKNIKKYVQLFEKECLLRGITTIWLSVACRTTVEIRVIPAHAFRILQEECQ